MAASPMRRRRRPLWTAIVWVAAIMLPRPTEASDDHWAFQPIRDVQVPPGDQGGASDAHPIDRFIGAARAAHGVSPSAPADRRTLIRRVSFDLTGLPPTPGEVEAFLADNRPHAFDRVVERLLASPGYGERWGRWWLDLARYADTNGQDENKVMANAWRYRDWVIRAFTADQPFDQFATDQIAGDLLPTAGVSEETIFDRWTATGLLVLGPKMLAEQDKPKLVMDIVDEQIDVVSRAFLGLTVGCARCHDHKFDPISARDYYALAGIFKSTRAMENLEFVSKFNERQIATQGQLAAIEAHTKALAAKADEIQAAIATANAAVVTRRKQDFGINLAAALSRDPKEGLAPAGALVPDPEAVPILRTLVAPDPATNSVSRILRERAASPERLADFLRELAAEPADSTGLRLAAGRVGAGFLATGRNRLDIAAAPALDPPHLTVEAWVRSGTFPTEGETRRWLVNKNGNEWVEGHYALVIDRDRAGAYLNIGGGRENTFSVWSGGIPLTPDHWHHLACTYDGTVLRLFVDGLAAGETSVNRPRVPGTGSLALACREDGYVHFQGRLDEVRIFSRALTTAEIKAHFDQPAQPAGDGVVACWDFNDLPDADREAVAQADLREALFGPGGAMALPADPRPKYPATTRDAIAALERERDALQAAPPPPVAFALAVDEGPPVDLPVHIRGSHLNLEKDPVPRGFLQAVGGAGSPLPPAHQSGRLELARWLTRADNPLTARVVVNRIWQAHFGEGLVRTPDNFGVRGERPTHPELLDWLAREFIRSGWSVKGMHRLILSSATWQQGDDRREADRDSDPGNRLLGHFPRQRLDAEMIRDALLAVSGRLDRTVGGSLTNWKNNEYAPADEVTATSVRRSVYLPIVRDRVYDGLTLFDFANPSVGTAKRTPTVVSHQALFFLNSPLVKECAKAFAGGLLDTPAVDDPARIRLAYERTYSRPPTEAETGRALRFLAAVEGGDSRRPRTAAWSALCQALFAANEFVYRD